MHCLLNFLLYRGGFRWFHRPRFFPVTIKTIIKSASTEEPSAEHVLWPLSPWPPAFISCSLQSILLRLWLAPGWGIEQGFGSCAACATVSLAKLIKASLLPISASSLSLPPHASPGSLFSERGQTTTLIRYKTRPL